MHLTHSEILLMASVAAARLGLVDVITVYSCAGQFCNAINECFRFLDQRKIGMFMFLK